MHQHALDLGVSERILSVRFRHSGIFVAVVLSVAPCLVGSCADLRERDALVSVASTGDVDGSVRIFVRFCDELRPGLSVEVGDGADGVTPTGSDRSTFPLGSVTEGPNGKESVGQVVIPADVVHRYRASTARVFYNSSALGDTRIDGKYPPDSAFRDVRGDPTSLAEFTSKGSLTCA